MQHDRWHLGLLAREATRNVLGSGSRMLVLLALAVVGGAGSSAYMAIETHTMRQEIEDLADAGRNVLVFSGLSSEAPASVSRRSCEVLAAQHGIDHAGLLESDGQLDLMPVGPRLPVQRASTSLFPELGAVDLLVGEAFPEREADHFVVLHGENTGRARRAAEHPEDLGTGSSITLPLRPGTTAGERCVVVLNAYSDADIAAGMVGAQLKTSANPVKASELLTATNDPITNYLQRPGRWLPVLIGLVGALATVITFRLRASEVAVYRMSGTGRVSLLTLLTLEALLIAGFAATAGTSASMVLSSYYLDPAIPILSGLVLSGLWACVAVAASLDLAFRRPSDLAKDR